MPATPGQRASQVVLVLSAWGLVQLAATGLCLHLRSPAFAEDVLVGGGHGDEEQQAAAATPERELAYQLELGYARGALNCWVAALLFAVTGCLSALHGWAAARTKEVESEQFY